MSNQYDTNEPSEESAVIDAVGSEKNVTDNSDDCSDVKASTSKIINKLVDLPKMTSETNVSHNSNDELCIKEFESTSESKTSKNDTNINSTEEKNQNHEYFVSSEPQDNNDTKKKIVESNHSHEYFVSSDPQENEDNNNPEWELLRKLETDEERYKAVRMRWKNLVIPNPNQNLSYRNEGITKPLNENPRTSRKRTLSDNSKLETNYKEQKRARTMSCTALFDQKVQKLHNSMNQTIRRIENNAHQAVHDLNFRETRSFMYRPPGSRAEEVYREAVHIQVSYINFVN